MGGGSEVARRQGSPKSRWTRTANASRLLVSRPMPAPTHCRQVPGSVCTTGRYSPWRLTWNDLASRNGGPSRIFTVTRPPARPPKWVPGYTAPSTSPARRRSGTRVHCGTTCSVARYRPGPPCGWLSPWPASTSRSKPLGISCAHAPAGAARAPASSAPPQLDASFIHVRGWPRILCGPAAAGTTPQAPTASIANLRFFRTETRGPFWRPGVFAAGPRRVCGARA